MSSTELRTLGERCENGSAANLFRASKVVDFDADGSDAEKRRGKSTDKEPI
jgi:hypothetical protein